MEDNKKNGGSSHPVGTSVGVVVGGPVATANATATAVNPKEQHAYWRDNYAKQAYVELSAPYGEYAPAYQYGWESHERMAGKSFDQSEGELARGWNDAKRKSTLSWEKAKAATKDAWDRIEGGR